jgi:hypothetical protein
VELELELKELAFAKRTRVCASKVDIEDIDKAAGSIDLAPARQH